MRLIDSAGASDVYKRESASGGDDRVLRQHPQGTLVAPAVQESVEGRVDSYGCG